MRKLYWVFLSQMIHILIIVFQKFQIALNIVTMIRDIVKNVQEA